MPQSILRNIANDDLTARFTGTSTVVASPTDNTETIVASLTLPGFGDTPIVTGVRLQCSMAFTAGTSGTAATLRIRRTNASGTVVFSTGALDVTAAHLYCPSIVCFDSNTATSVYVATLTVTGGAAASTVSAVHLSAVMQ